MSSGTDIIQEALGEIGAHSIAAVADPDSIVKGMNVLNSMLQLWLSKGIDLGIVPLDAPGDELSEPLDARTGIVENLAILLAPKFDNGKVVVSQTLKDNARLSKVEIKNLYQVLTIPDKVVSSTLPRGQGNNCGLRLRRVFAGKGATLDSSNS